MEFSLCRSFVVEVMEKYLFGFFIFRRFWIFLLKEEYDLMDYRLLGLEGILI